jgi:Xaa-Pro aminopeptidase
LGKRIIVNGGAIIGRRRGHASLPRPEHVKLFRLTEFEQRRQAAAAQLASRKVDAVLVSSPASVRYLTGYTGSNGLVLLTRSEGHFFTDPRYATDAASLFEATQSVVCRLHVAKKPLIQEAAGVIKRKKLKKIGFEPAWMHVEEHQNLEKALSSGASLLPVGGLVEGLRMVKSTSEIDKIRRSVLVNSEAYSRTMRRVHPGVREREIAAELDYQMRALGAEKPAFDTIVATGARSALPHAHPTSHRLAENELLLIDMGATVDGYTSDMTRVAFAGVPPKRIRQLYKAVAEAQLAAVDAVCAGATTKKVDSAARDVLKRHGLEREFLHSTGHGLGLEIHESPRVAKKDKSKLQAGMVITIEPGAYIEGLGGVRIEDTVLVTATGCEVLTPTSKEFVNL